MDIRHWWRVFKKVITFKRGSVAGEKIKTGDAVYLENGIAYKSIESKRK